LGAVFPHFCPDKREIWHVYRGNVSPLRGEKPIFGPLSKNNTGMVALRAGLPVIKSYNTTTGFEHTTYAIKPEHLAHWAMAAVGDIGVKVQYKLVHVRYTPARA